MDISIGSVLSELRERAGMSQLQLAARLTRDGFPVSNKAVSRWERDAAQPSAVQFIQLCRIFGVHDVTALFFGESAGDYGRLNRTGRARVAEYISLLASSHMFDREERPVLLRSLPVYDIAASAGTGQFLDGSGYELTEVGGDVPLSANFGIRIAGDSMSPRYSDGQTVWVRQQPTLQNGDIGIFLLDGCSYCKKLSSEADGVFLLSLNPAYPPIPVRDFASLRVFGKVLS